MTILDNLTILDKKAIIFEVSSNVEDMALETFSASDAKNHFGLLIDKAQKGPVSIEKKGRKVAIVLSPEEHARLEAMEDYYWALQADNAEAEGFLSKSESKNFLDSLGK